MFNIFNSRSIVSSVSAVIKFKLLKKKKANSQSGQLPVGLIAQLVQHFFGIAEVMGSNPVQPDFFFFFFFQALISQLLLSCVHNCDRQSYLYSL